MRIENLKSINSAPQTGHILAYFRKSGILFEKYEAFEQVVAKLNAKMADAEDTLLELHLFDTSKEYRCILTEAKSRVADYIEYFADFEEDADSVYAEMVELEKVHMGQLIVLNHISYQDNGMAVVDDYRLQMKEV